MKKISILFFAALMTACGSETNDLIVKGNIKDLKKGIVYLKKANDSSLVTVDSVIVSGNSNFQLQSPIESPEIFFLYLDKNSANNNEHIAFFADKGVTEINTTLKNFVLDAKIKGAEQQKVLEEYKAMISKMNESKLDLIKAKLEAIKAGDSLKLDSVAKAQNGLVKRKYLFTVNFALNHKDSEVAPYLALSEIYNARLDLLDTINKSLTPKVKTSKYGKELEAYIKQVKAQENQ